MSAKLTFLGAAGTVTGSRFLLQVNNRHYLVDCGLFQGGRRLKRMNWDPFPLPPEQVDAILLTHAHIDHTGYLPRLVRQGFRGSIYATEATCALAQIMLPDSAYLQEQDAAYALGVLNLRSYLTASLSGLVGWSVSAIIVIIGAGLAIMEATVQGDAAAAGNLETFAMWYALSRGVELLFILFPLAFLAITVVDLRAPTPMTPRWASALALVGAALVIPAVVGVSVFRLVAFGRLWAGAALPMIWFIWLGVHIASQAQGA